MNSSCCIWNSSYCLLAFLHIFMAIFDVLIFITSSTVRFLSEENLAFTFLGSLIKSKTLYLLNSWPSIWIGSSIMSLLSAHNDILYVEKLLTFPKLLLILIYAEWKEFLETEFCVWSINLHLIRSHELQLVSITINWFSNEFSIVKGTIVIGSLFLFCGIFILWEWCYDRVSGILSFL